MNQTEEWRRRFPLCFRCDHTLWHWQQLLSHCRLHLLIVWFCLWTLPLLSRLTGGESWFPFEVHGDRKRLRQSGAAKKSPEGQSLWKLSACCEVMERTQTLPTLCTLINFTPPLLDETLLGCFIQSHYLPDMKIQSLGGFQRLSRVHHFS